MKKEDYILVLFFLILFSSFFVSNPNMINIIGKSIFDIKATYGSLSLSITIDNSSPNVVIYYPLNNTYNHKGNISLNYHVSDLYSSISKVWYNIDNGANTTLTGNITFSIINDGSHILYIFSNDTLNFLNNSESISFFVNTSVIYNVTSDYDGATTNFNSLNRTQQENLNNMILEKSNFGKIKFNENINLSNDNKESGYQLIKDVDLISYSDISSNRIEINSNELPQLNKSAKLSLYNLTYSDPRILKDSVVCSSCVEESYSNGTLIFNVTGFSVYSAEETPTTPGGGPGDGGGSGGGRGGGVEEPIKPPEPVHEKGKLFDVEVFIPETYRGELYRNFFSGEELTAYLTITSLQDIGLVNVDVEYYIEDSNKSIVYKEIETKAIENKISYTKIIKLPQDIPVGNYMIFSRVTYKGDIATAGYPFVVIEKKHAEEPKKISSFSMIKNYIDYIVLSIIFIIFIILILFGYYEYKRFKNKKSKKANKDIKIKY